MAIPNNLVSTFTTKTGVVTVTIALSNPTEPDDRFDIYEIGSIEYDFDLTAYGDVINNVGAMYSRSRITCGLYARNGLNIFDTLFSYLFSGTISLPVSLVMNTHDGTAYEFQYEIRPTGLRYDENSLKLNIDLDPVVLQSVTVGDIYDDTASKFAVGPTLGTSTTAIMVGSFINTMVSKFNAGISTIHEPAYTTSGYSYLTYALPFIFPPDGIQLYMSASGIATEATQDLSRFAVLGGDIYGTGFDYNFYVNRLRTDRVVQVDYDEIESLEFSFTPSPYKTIALTMDSTSPSNLIDTTITASGNRFAEKSISGLYVMPSYVRKAQWSGALFADTDYSGYTTSDIETVITSSGIAAHQKALNASASPIIRVEAVVFGFDKIKPYEAIQFVGDVPDKYKYTTGTNPRYFRPTTLSYNLMDDKISVKMYSIN